jgi:hypothetical protein
VKLFPVMGNSFLLFENFALQNFQIIDHTVKRFRA